MIEKDEAIELLCAYGVPLDEKKFQEALDMAIKALSADGDLISRKAVLDTICSYGTELERLGIYQITVCNMKQSLCDLIEELPTIPQTDYANYEAFGWCKGCKEYDTEKHCCHRYSSFIRESLQDSINAVLEDIKEDILKEINNHSFFSSSQKGLAIAYKIIDKYISGKDQE